MNTFDFAPTDREWRVIRRSAPEPGEQVTPEDDAIVDQVCERIGNAMYRSDLVDDPEDGYMIALKVLAERARRDRAIDALIVEIGCTPPR